MLTKYMRGALLASLMATMASPASARWLKAETSHFRIYSEGSEKQLRTLAILLEDFDQLLRLLTATKAPPAANKLDVYLVGSRARLPEIRPVGPMVLGFYSATSGGIAAVGVRKDQFGIEGEEILLHEYAHHFMVQYSTSSYPAWYIEGFAEYVMTSTFSEKTIEFGKINPGRAYSLLLDQWLPMQTIFEGDVSKMSRTDTGIFYAPSWLITHYIFSTDGQIDKLIAYLGKREKGKTEREAFEEAFGMDYASFGKIVRKYGMGSIGYKRMDRPSAITRADVSVQPLPPAAEDLLLPALTLRLGRSDEEGKRLLPIVRRVAARYREDPYARRVLAHAELAFGDRARAVELLDALIAKEPADAELLYLRGCAELAAGRASATRRAEAFKASRQWFAKAHKADPNHYQTLYRYAESYSLAPMDDNTLNVLLMAQELAPQVDAITLNAAIALIQHKRVAEAERLLTPLTTNPHADSYGAKARELLQHARQGSVSAPDFAEPAGDEKGTK